MGYSLRSGEYHYTEWVHITVLEGNHNYQPAWDNQCDFGELYDLVNDYQENVNLYRDNRYGEVVEELSDKLRQGWRQVAEK